ncbi:MAG: DUF4422 domain-containing protein [Lachnospiraceae bacterium]|nr:DUF4422 domain-containing protein [Lachnospiraceae bacterium]
MQLAIFGAQGYALGAYLALKTLYPRRSVTCFLVSKMGGNASFLGNVPVRELAEFAKELSEAEKHKIEILIATPENVQPEIEETLENYGFRFYKRMDSKRWAELMKLYHVRLGRFLPLSALPVGYHKPFIRIYAAKSHKDRPLKQNVSLPDYVYSLQVGAANCSVSISDIGDNRGEHISGKNGNYSELTGLYWIWKNKLCKDGSTEGNEGQYFGLAQYRRMLDLSSDDILRLKDNDVDVVLPYPMPYEPDIHAHHKRYLQDTDWNAMLQALQELRPEYAEAFPQVLKQQYLYNYNVILAKKSVLKEYCEWLFPVLERTEELSVPKGNERMDRYIGYMGESLETLYFIKNADRLNIVHTECRMYL